jgi:glycosyltransferase involved in cell wall biosynthesis
MTYSLVIASYKYGHLAAHAIETALSQAKPFDKIYFVDDGIGDCTHLPKLYPQVEYVLRDKNLGIVANFQDMLNRVETDYVMFLGADNWITSDTLLMLSQYKEDIITYNIMVTGELKDEIVKLYPQNTYYSCGDVNWTREHLHHGSMMYRVAKAKEVGGYEKHRPDGERTDEDNALWDKMIKAAATVKYVKSSFLYYRRHKQNFNKY